MAAIDSRATVTCNLGEVISGGVSDSYLQGSGLVMTRGQITLAGTKTPEIGSEVQIDYSMNSGGGGRIPRSLRVLSAFADPLRETTEVSLGCLLTYLDGIMPVPSLQDGRASYVSPRQLECLNGLPKSAFPPPIMANDIFKFCLDGVNLIGNANLINSYMMDSYDLSGGYIQAIGNLLLSESKFAYASESTNRLVVGDLSDTGGSGSSSISEDDLIDISAVNNGEQPPTIVIVPYIDKKLETYEPDDARWEEVEVIGDPETIRLSWSTGTTTVTHTPTTKTISIYGEPNDLTDQCELFEGGYGNLENTVIRTETIRSVVLGQAASGYATAVYEGGGFPSVSLKGEIKEITEYEFDDRDRPVKSTTSIYEPMFAYAGRMSLPWVIGNASVSLGSEPVLVEKRIEQFDYAGESVVPTGVRPGQDVPENVVYQRVSQYTYNAWGKTQGGSQGPAESTNAEAFSSTAAVLSYIRASTGLVLTDSSVRANKAFNPKGSVRPGEADRSVQQGTLDGNGRKTKFVELQFANQGLQPRVTQYSPPLLTESYFSSGGTAVSVDSYAMSAKFGRAQHRLSLGNRFGMNIQVPPDRAPKHPGETFTISLAGYSGRYAANGINYSFDSSGIICSVDGLYIGGMGINGGTKSAKNSAAPWFYLPSGYNPANLPLASAGQLISPFNEIINVSAGCKLGAKIESQLAETLIPEIIHVGVAIGVAGTNNETKQSISTGLSVGCEVIGLVGNVEKSELGVKVGINVLSEKVNYTLVTPGVRIGTLIGPAAFKPELLINFETDWNESGIMTEQSDNQFEFTQLFNSIPDYFPSFPDEPFGPRFGDGCALTAFYDSDDDLRGGFVSTDPDFVVADSWTAEFWINPLGGFDAFRETSDTRNVLTLAGPAGLNPYGVTGLTFGVKTEFGVSDDTTTSAYLTFSEYLNNDQPISSRIEVANPLAPKLLLDTWQHVAFVKNAETGGPEASYSLYLNGVRVQQTMGYWANENHQIDAISIGCSCDGAGEFNSRMLFGTFIDELRFVNGKAIYTESSFTPPVGPF